MLRTAARGYARRPVDDLLARVAATLGRRAAEFPELRGCRVPDRPVPPLDAGDVRGARFPVGLRGYDMAQVDALLERVANALPGEDERPTWDRPTGPIPVLSAVPDLRLRHAPRGYDVEEVDAFLVRCAHSLGSRIDRVPELGPLRQRSRSGERLRARDVETAQFRLRLRGYAVDQVDALLDRVAAALAD